MDIFEKEKILKNLLNNKGFQELIMDDFINGGILALALHDNVSSEAIQDQLKARKILFDYLYGIINQSEIMRTEGESNGN